MAFDQISTSVSIISSGLKSYQAISLTNFVTSAESIIASGSAVEIANAFFLADGNITPNASSWTAIGTGNAAFLTLLASGSAGSQVLSAAYSATSPVWHTQHQGWYLSAASLVRYVAAVHKTGTSSYEWAHILPTRQEEPARKKMDIGDWNMNADLRITVPHGIPSGKTKILDVAVMIRRDADDFIIPLLGWNTTTGTGSGNIAFMDDADINFDRGSSGIFHNVDFDLTSFNRGWILISYAL